jgi:hypothetical protein
MTAAAKTTTKRKPTAAKPKAKPPTKKHAAKTNAKPAPAVVALQAVRAQDGVYEVVGASRPVRIERYPKYWWTLVVDGKPAGKFRSKGLALQHCREHPEL